MICELSYVNFVLQTVLFFVVIIFLVGSGVGVRVSLHYAGYIFHKPLSDNVTENYYICCNLPLSLSFYSINHFACGDTVLSSRSHHKGITLMFFVPLPPPSRYLVVMRLIVILCFVSFLS